MIERGGAVVIRMLENVQQVTIKPLIQATIAPGTLVYTDEYDTRAVWKNGATITKVYATVRGNMPAMTTVTTFVKSMSTPWKGSGCF
jgi:transposase